jgi:PAS domain S-box-containing protein
MTAANEKNIFLSAENNVLLNNPMFEGSPDCVKILDVDGHLLAMNRNGMCTMEIDRFESVCGADWHSLWPAESYSHIQAAIDAAKSGQTGHFTAPAPTAKGTPKWWDVVVSPIYGTDGMVQTLLSVSRDITAFHQGEEERLRLAEQRQLALDSAELGAWHVEPVTMAFSADQRFRSIFGLGEENLSYEQAVAAIHPDDQARVRLAVNAAIEPDHPVPYETEYRVVHANGEIHWVHAKGRVNYRTEGQNWMLASFDGTVADITERKRADKEREFLFREVQAAKDRMAEIFQQAPAFMCVLQGPEHVFELANDLYLQLVGRQNLIGLPVRQALPELEGQGFFDLLDQVFRTGEAYSGKNARAVLRRGPNAQLEERFLDFVYLPLRDAYGVITGIFVHGVDLTEHKHAEDALRKLAAELSEADRRKNEFLATLAHELRNPLAPIRNGLHVMRLASDNPDRIAQVREMMERQVAQMVHLVDDLLDVARISSGKIELKKEQTEVKTVVLSAIETSLPLIESHHHELKVSLDEKEPFLVEADPIRLSQVLSNLLNNAAKYTLPGGRIDLSVSRDNQMAVISVRDSGIGLSADALTTVFEMFSQVRSASDHARGGLGIGLSLVRRLVEMHGGTVSASSPGPGKGSLFTVRLPLICSAGESLAAPLSPDVPAQARKKLRVLVVDDNIDTAESLSALLEISGHVTRIAHEGRAALILADDFRPDVAFLDIGLPGLNGYELAQALRRAPGLENIMLVALTGWGTHKDRIHSHNAEFDLHLTKPANLEAVERVLGTAQGKVKTLL